MPTMLIQILSAALATLASIVDTSAAQAPLKAVIVCDATRLGTSPRVIDFTTSPAITATTVARPADIFWRPGAR